MVWQHEYDKRHAERRGHAAKKAWHGGGETGAVGLCAHICVCWCGVTVAGVSLQGSFLQQ